MSWEDDKITLKSGKILYANKQIIGINPELRITEGYDGSLPTTVLDDYWKYCDQDQRLTKEECIEIAELMIERWNEFKRKCENVNKEN